MEDKNFYTIEGQRYYLRSANKYTPLTENIGGFVIPTILVNFDQYSPVVQPWMLELRTAKKIIPISCSLGISDGSTNNCNITSVYWNAQIGGLTSNNFQGINCLSRMIPFSDKVFFDSNSSYQYNVFYDKVTLSENDFIDPTVGIQIIFNSQIVSCILQNNNEGFSLPVFDYQFDITFLFFESE